MERTQARLAPIRDSRATFGARSATPIVVVMRLWPWAFVVQHPAPTSVEAMTEGREVVLRQPRVMPRIVSLAPRPHVR